MKKLSILILIFILTAGITLGMTVATAADKLTARSMGMGGAYTAVAEDISTILYNPAGITRSGSLEVHGSIGTKVSDFDQYRDLLDLVDYFQNDFDKDNLDKVKDKLDTNLNLSGQNFLGGNLQNLGFALNFKDEVQAQENDRNIEQDPDLKNTALAEGMFTYGKKVLDPTADIMALSYGINLRYGKRREDRFELNSDENELIAINGEGTGFGADVGVLVKTTDLLRIGVQIKNLIATSYSLKGEKEIYTYDGSGWKTDTTQNWEKDIEVESNMTVGAALDVPVLDATLAMDLENFPLLSEGDMYTRMGIEKNIFFDGFTLRGGTYKEPEQDRMYTVGFGINLVKFHVDAALGSDDSFDKNKMFLLSGNMKF